MKKYNKVIVFVHGLGGAVDTWGNFEKLISEDPELQWDVVFFTFPSPKLGIRLFPFIQFKYQPIQVLADALRTAIDEQLQAYDEVVLVGHSLGGLVIRKYILSEIHARRTLRVSKVVLYAVPNDGSGLAAVSRELSIGTNGHVKQLCRNSEFLENLRTDWARVDVSSQVEFTVVVGGNDHIVTRASAEGNFRSPDLEPKVILSAGHRNISKPENHDDLRYIILRNALKKKRSLGQGRLSGSRLIKELARYKDMGSLPFQLDKSREGYLQSLIEHFGKARSVVRVTGLSGLGKTRLVYEAANAVSKEDTTDIVYYDAAQDSIQILAWLRDCILAQKYGTLIVDNCSVLLHADLQREVQRIDSNICLITVDYSPERTVETTMIRLDRFSDDVIEAMLSPIYVNNIENFELKKIVRFAQGFPRLAVMLAEARIAEDGALGNLTDDLIAKKLLWGNEQPNAISEKILQGCALFDHFGLEAEVRDQLQFISKIAIGVEEETAYECIQQFVERGLIDRRGRLAQLVPKPLAIRLAAQWWHRTQKERQLKLIAELPEVLEESFCSQIARLDFLPEVKNLTEDLCGIQGPFGDAELILSRRGSALFRALVEVNPDATATSIERVILPLTTEKLLDIQGETRRNLVWGLEKLSVRQETFSRAAGVLLRLAGAENETWSNNATGMFCQLFRIYLSGTAASPTARFAFLRESLDLKNDRYAAILTEALESAIDLRGGSRTIGAEYQGSAPPIEEWQPEIWQDIFDYVHNAGSLLLEIFDNYGECKERVRAIVGNSIRLLIANGRVELIERMITHIVAADGYYWPEALEAIKNSLAYDLNDLPPNGQEALRRWHDLLSGTRGDIIDRVRILVISPPFEHEELPNGELVDVAKKRSEELAKLVPSNSAKLLSIIKLLTGPAEHRQTFFFAKALALAVDDSVKVIVEAINALERQHGGSAIFLCGLLHGQYVASPKKWNEVIAYLEQRGTLDRLYPEIVRTGEITEHHLAHIIALANAGRTPLPSLRTLSVGDPLGELLPETVIHFIGALLNFDDRDAAWIALDVLFMYCYGNTDKRLTCLGKFEEIVLLCKFEGSVTHMNLHEWTTVCQWLINSDKEEFAIRLTIKICEIISSTTATSSYIDEMQKLVKELLKSRFEVVWPILRDAVSLSRHIGRLHFTWLFQSKRSFSRRSEGGLIELVPNDELISWGRTHPSMAPAFVANTLDFFPTDGSTSEVNSLVAALLAEFEDENQVVSSSLEANMNTRSWSGSLIPLLEQDKSLLEALSKHSSHVVSTWALRHLANVKEAIKREVMREEERLIK